MYGLVLSGEPLQVFAGPLVRHRPVEMVDHYGSGVSQLLLCIRGDVACRKDLSLRFLVSTAFHLAFSLVRLVERVGQYGSGVIRFSLGVLAGTACRKGRSIRFWCHPLLT